MKNRYLFLLAGVLVLVVLFKWQENRKVIARNQGMKPPTARQQERSGETASGKNAFETFYDRFRLLMLAEDRRELRRLTDFPVALYEPEKEQIYEELDESRFFDEFLAGYLERKNGCPCTGEVRRRAESLASCIPENQATGDRRIRKGDLVFVNRNGSWKLTGLYLNRDGN